MPSPWTVAVLGVALLTTGCSVETAMPPPGNDKSEPKPAPAYPRYTGYTYRGPYRTYFSRAVPTARFRGGPSGPFRGGPTARRPIATRPTTRRGGGLVGNPVPKFQMTDLNGHHLTPESLKGKVVLIDFWATWCGPCRAASPMLQRLHEKYGERGLVVIGANVAERDSDGKLIKTKDAAEKYSSEHKLTYTFTYANEAFAGACHVRGIPTMLVLDKDGVVRKVQVGLTADLYKTLEEEIVPLLDATN